MGSGTASFQGFQSLFFVDLVYVVFIASPRECFSLTLLLFYLAKKMKTLSLLLIVYTIYLQ